MRAPPSARAQCREGRRAAWGAAGLRRVRASFARALRAASRHADSCPLLELLTFVVPHFDRTKIQRADRSLDGLQITNRNDGERIGLQIGGSDATHVGRSH